MSIFNLKQIFGMFTGKYPCPKCGAEMEWENDSKDILICPKCGYDISSDKYGFSDEEYDDLYTTSGNDDRGTGETYDEVFDEISDD